MRIKDIEIHSFKGLESISLTNCGKINAIVGKNNSGKSSILHAIDMAGLALTVRNWGRFQPKLAIKDLFASVGDFEISVRYEDDSNIQIKADANFGPIFTPGANESQKFKSILILPDVGYGMLRRENRTPKWIIQQVETRNFASVNSLQILYAIKYYAMRRERELKPENYEHLLSEIKHFFQEVEELESDRTEDDIPTLKYVENGKMLDILYSGSGLRHFMDVLLKVTVSGADVVLIDEPEMALHPDLQRRFLEYLHRLAEERKIQFFLATHSQVLLSYADIVSYYRIVNKKGKRDVLPVPNDAIHMLLSDLGLRPSDVFNQDICLLVEGASDVIFLEHVIRNLYKTDFENIAIGVLQYGGSAADGIVSGTIDVSNITPAQKYTYWIRDRDAKPTEEPNENSTKFQNALRGLSLDCHIWNKREIEFYYPQEVLVAAQQGDTGKEQAVINILNGDQSEKFVDAAREHEVCVPCGKYLRKLLEKHLVNKNQLDVEIKDIIETKLLIWKREILGE
jgi:predicted ATP-dependent endonuclease of OLD family